MACCYKNNEGWCKDPPLVRTDAQGREFCIFHAPVDLKGQSLEKFNDLIFGQINEPLKIGEVCDLSGTIFLGDIDFSAFNNNNPLPAISLNEATFSGETVFMGTTFSGDVDFSGCTFKGRANFLKSNFNGKANFRKSTFNNHVNFLKSNFSGDAVFSESNFKDFVILAGSKFCGNADFSKSTFSGGAAFMESIFSENANFWASTFNDHVSFEKTIFKGNVDFSHVTFSCNVAFSKSTFSGNVDFMYAYFDGKSHFYKSNFTNNADFRKIDLKNTNILTFTEVDFTDTRIMFLETNIHGIQFHRCVWPQKKMFFLPNSETTDVLYDEINADKIFSGCTQKGLVGSRKEWAKTYGMVGDLYRQLKQKHKEEHNEVEVSKWHYREKEMFRKKTLRRRVPFCSFSWLYWAFSGYGERPIRAGLVCLMLFSTSMLLMNYWGLSPNKDSTDFNIGLIKGFSGSFDWMKFKLLFENAFQNALFIKTPRFVPLTITGNIWLIIITKIFIPIQAALFAFSLRNRFRR